MVKQAEEFRGLSPDELTLLIEEGRSELFRLNNELAETGKCEKSHLIPATRRKIAKALTVLAEKRKSS